MLLDRPQPRVKFSSSWLSVSAFSCVHVDRVCEGQCAVSLEHSSVLPPFSITWHYEKNHTGKRQFNPYTEDTETEKTPRLCGFASPCCHCAYITQRSSIVFLNKRLINNDFISNRCSGPEAPDLCLLGNPSLGPVLSETATASFFKQTHSLRSLLGFHI